MTYYKAVRLDRTSHYDQKTKWRVGSIIRSDSVDLKEVGPCGHGIHCSPNIRGAVQYQTGVSRYCEVEPIKIIAKDKTKSRCEAVKVVRWLGREEQDELAGFKLYEANHPINPLLVVKRQKKIDIEDLVKQWDSVRASVWASVGASVGASVRASVWASVWDSVWASVWDYVGGLFPKIKTWKYAEKLGPDPWRPLLTLWYAGYVPSFDGTTWRVHAGKNARIVWQENTTK